VIADRDHPGGQIAKREAGYARAHSAFTRAGDYIRRSDAASSLL
jgi:hypothetical protein